MVEHKCPVGNVWRNCPAAECARCHPVLHARAPGYLREGYATSTQKTIKDPRGSNQTEHWSGRQDAEIRPGPVTLKARTNRTG
jgi:hypothetical protein